MCTGKQNKTKQSVLCFSCGWRLEKNQTMPYAMKKKYITASTFSSLKSTGYVCILSVLNCPEKSCTNISIDTEVKGLSGWAGKQLFTTNSTHMTFGDNMILLYTTVIPNSSLFCPIDSHLQCCLCCLRGCVWDTTLQGTIQHHTSHATYPPCTVPAFFFWGFLRESQLPFLLLTLWHNTI